MFLGITHLQRYLVVHKTILQQTILHVCYQLWPWWCTIRYCQSSCCLCSVEDTWSYPFYEGVQSSAEISISKKLIPLHKSYDFHYIFNLCINNVKLMEKLLIKMVDGKIINKNGIILFLRLNVISTKKVEIRAYLAFHLPGPHVKRFLYTV